MPTIRIEEIAPLAKEYGEFFDQFNDAFVGREDAIRLLRYAMLTRQHFLEFGPPGTAKTAICDLVFDYIDDANIFRTELSAFMANDALYGPYDMKALREDSTLKHRTEGMLPEADLARIGEFLDGSPQTLRSLLGAMNERRIRFGRQQIEIPLQTVYGDTNISPHDYLQQYPKAFAVIDRILYMDYLGYLNDPKQVRDMVFRFQRGATKRVEKRISLTTIKKLSSLIVSPPGLITDETVLDTYADIVSKYRNMRQAASDEIKAGYILPEISDRRVVHASLVLEAEAVLAGRVSVEPDDILAAGIVLCTSDAERKMWDELAKPAIKANKDQSVTLLSSTVGTALQGIAAQLESEVLNAPANRPTEKVGQTLQVLWEQLNKINPKEQGLCVIKDDLREKFRKAAKQLQEQALHKSNLVLAE